LREEEVSESRRDLRRQRRKERGLAGLIARWRVPGRSKKGAEDLPPGETRVPKSRRELRAKRRKKKGGGLTEFVVTIIVAFVLVFGVVQPFIVQAFRIPSESMVPTLEIGDRLLANKFIYRFTEPERGDIVVFDSLENDDTLIKRVVGLEGDEIRVQGGLLFVNGEPQEEPYLNEEEPFRGYYGPLTVPKGDVFVMGDNRGNSADSRVFGPVPLDNIKGEAFIRFWPISKIGDL